MSFKEFSDKYTLVQKNCLWLAVNVQFIRGKISGKDAPELWRAVIKDGLLASRPDEAMLLLEPLRTQGLGTNVDCPGLVIECRDQPTGARIFLKFLGSAFRFAPACLLALEAGLRSGVGRQKVEGSMQGLQAWQGGQWHDIDMPFSSQQLQPWCACPAVLAGYSTTVHSTEPPPGQLTLITRSRWVWRKQGALVQSAPDLADVLDLVAQRVERFHLAWGTESAQAWYEALAGARLNAQHIRRVEHSWKLVHRQVGGHYPGHGHQGHVTYEGVMSEALLFCLYVGSFLHVGQQTSIGQGGYSLDFPPLQPPGTALQLQQRTTGTTSN